MNTQKGAKESLAVKSATGRAYRQSYGGKRMDEVALEFATAEDFDAALQIIFREQPPTVIVGDRTVVVPKTAVKLFESLKFEPSAVLSASDLPPEEAAALRGENLGFGKS